jgi:hypothetical protein
MTSMNEADLAARTALLPELFAGRLPDSALDGIRSMASGGEWDELLDLLLAALTQTGAVVTAEERDQLRAVLTGWGLPTSVVDNLTVSG